ncbi:hypothetical protein [Sulfurimonas sp.]
MKKRFIFFIFLSSIFTSLDASEISDLAFKYNLYPGNKATIQWERIFSSQRRLKKYKLNTLTLDTQLKLKLYLIKHAADSEQPIVPGL